MASLHVTVEELEAGKERGRSCYGAVYEVKLHGLPCILTVTYTVFNFNVLHTYTYDCTSIVLLTVPIGATARFRLAYKTRYNTL